MHAIEASDNMWQWFVNLLFKTTCVDRVLFKKVPGFMSMYSRDYVNE